VLLAHNAAADRGTKWDSPDLVVLSRHWLLKWRVSIRESSHPSTASAAMRSTSRLQKTGTLTLAMPSSSVSSAYAFRSPDRSATRLNVAAGFGKPYPCRSEHRSA
jgi:hypothetical protein